MFNKEKLRAYLKEHEMTTAEFGKRIGTSGQFVAYLANGLKQPSVALLKQIAIVLGCTTDELIV